MERFIKQRLVYILFDLILVFLSFLAAIMLKSGSLEPYFYRYFYSFLVFLSIWIAGSWFFKKYSFHDYNQFNRVIRPILISNFVIAGTIALMMYLTRRDEYSRYVVFVTIIIASFLELVLGLTYHFLRAAKINDNPPDREYMALKAQEENGENGVNGNGANHKLYKLSDKQKESILQECNGGTIQFIEKNNIYPPEELHIVSTTNPINIIPLTEHSQKSIINLKRVNDIRFLNRLFDAVNNALPDKGTYICCVETKDLRKQRIFRKYLFPFNYLYYYLMDFPIKRVFPKFNITKGIYLFLTRGQNRVITRAETLGRLISSGFEVLDEEYIDNLCYIIVRKIKPPAHDPDPSYGPLVRLKRVGKGGKTIKVYKMRTMYPYAEYLQDYIYQRFNLKEGGKFDHDFRVSTQGRIMRKFWIDELPMLINMMRGDLKLVGVRPLSKHYFNLYSRSLQDLRIRFKPGLIPPFYADMPKTLKEIQESEKNYLLQYKKKPFRTDWKYFWKAWYNIIFKKARSQ